jgi:hypothetical protein
LNLDFIVVHSRHDVLSQRSKILDADLAGARARVDMKASHNQRATTLFNFAHYPDRTERRFQPGGYDGIVRKFRDNFDLEVVS